ncbi:MAG: PilZ domain-containing protein [Myxococcota bacterium]|nr:PilZ domain-containing protein [Myxococcota bacterium]
MSQTTERRRSRRILTRFDALLSSGREEGSGVLADISLNGAAFTDASFAPPPGTLVRAYVFVRPVSPFELVGRVVRREGDAFAIEYEKLEAETQRLVEDVAGLVSVPPRE